MGGVRIPVLVTAAAATLVVALFVALSAAADASAVTRAWHATLEAPAPPPSATPALAAVQRAAATPVAPQAKGATVTVFSDTFESGLSQWKLTGNPGWAATTYRAAAGSRSAYCAGSSITPPGPYANNMNAWMEIGPFDLSTLTSGTFSLKMYSVTELDKDKLGAYVSLNGTDYSGTVWSGSYDSWTDKSIDLTNVYSLGNVCGKPQVWFAIVFGSNASVVMEGSYVDEVNITGTSSGGGGTPGQLALILTADAEVVPYDGSVGLTGAMLDVTAGTLVPNKEAGLAYSQDDKIDADWNLITSATSDTGEYAFTVTGIKRLTYFTLVFAGDAQYQESMMWPPVKVNARARVTPPAVPSSIRANVPLTFWGTIQPPHTASQNKASHTKVIAEHYLGGRWQSVLTLYANKYKNTKTATKYAVTLRYAPGKWRLRAVHQDDDHALSTSSWCTFTAR